MKAAVFVEPGRIALDEEPLADVRAVDALIGITTTTICGGSRAAHQSADDTVYTHPSDE